MKIQTYFLVHAVIRALALAIIGQTLSTSYSRVFNLTSAGKAVEYKNVRLNEQNGKLKVSPVK